jgi:hypothetical protein
MIFFFLFFFLFLLFFFLLSSSPPSYSQMGNHVQTKTDPLLSAGG